MLAVFRLHLALLTALELVHGTATAATVEVHGEGSCLNAEAARTELAALLAARSETRDQELKVEVWSTAEQEGTSDVHLLVTRGSGDVLLDRRYSLRAVDCASAVDLLKTVLERFLAEIPTERWREPAPAASTSQPPPAVPSRRPEPQHEWGIDVLVSPSVAWPPANEGVAVGGRLVSSWPVREVSAGVIARGYAPRRLGPGHFTTGNLLVGVGWSIPLRTWSVGAEVRGGALWAAGYGFEHNHVGWLPWGEGAVLFEHRIGWFRVGAEGAVSLPDRRVATAGQRFVVDLPPVAVGVRVLGRVRTKKW